MKKKLIIIISSIVAVFLIALLILFNTVLKKDTTNPPGTIGNTAGNLYNGGLFCESSDGYVYFSNLYDNKTMYRMHPDETGAKKLTHTSCESINADANNVYFYQGRSNGGAGLGFLISQTGIYKFNKKDSNTITCLDRVLGKYLILADNDLFYTSSEDKVSLKKSSIDGKTKTVMLESDILPASIQDSTFYYINNQKDLHLMAMDIKTGATRQVLAEDIYMPIIDGNNIYGIDIHDNYSLIKIDASTGTKTVLDNSARVDMLNVTDNYIYYQTSSSLPALKRVLKDGTNMEIVASGVYNSIHVTSKYVYFVGFSSEIPVYKTPAEGPISVTTFDTALLAARENEDNN